MNDEHAEHDFRRLIADAVEDARDAPLEPARLATVRRLLEARPEARRYYLETTVLMHALSSQPWLPATNDVASGDGDPSAGVGRPAGPTDVGGAAPSTIGHWPRKLALRPGIRRFAGRAVLVAAAVAVAAIAVGIMIWPRDRKQPTERPRGIASLEQVHGNVSVTTAAADTSTIGQAVEIRSGDTVRTQGALGSAVLAYPDGTRLSLVGDTSLTAAGDGRKSIVLHGGTIFGSVVAQPTQRPMFVVTPQDKVQVMGTRFALEATTIATDLSVSEGSVRLTRLRDGHWVDVAAGRRVFSTAASTLVAEPIPQVPDEWSEDFETGLPEGWGVGKLVAADLPPGSTGAVQATRDAAAADDSLAIATQQHWTYGLFAAHDDTHLHFTLSMRDPGWFNILILTRTADGDPPTFAGNYIFDKPVWQGQPGAWGEISIPLSEFRPLPPSRDSFENAIPFQVLFSTPDRDRGLVIDRIWVTRGGPGVVEAKE